MRPPAAWINQLLIFENERELMVVLTVSATEMVSLRSFSRVATSLTISRSSCGGNEDVDMVAFCFEIDLEYGKIESVNSARRRLADCLERTEKDCMCEQSASAIVGC
jgi:hypothetical protein